MKTQINAEQPYVSLGVITATLPDKFLTRIIWFVVLCNALALAGTTFVLWVTPQMHVLPARFSSPTWGEIIRQGNLAAENTLVTWYSSMLLMATGMLAICALSANKSTEGRQDRFHRGWLLIALLFFALSLDEMGSIHENAGRLSGLDLLGDDSWESVLAIPGALIVIYMIAFAWTHLRRQRVTFSLMILGSLLYVTVPVQEHFEFSPGIAAAGARPVHHVLLEEGCELFGTWAFMVSMVVFIRNRSNNTSTILLSFSPRALYRTLLIAVPLLSILLLFFLQFSSVLADDEGVALNWFAAASVLLCSMLIAMLLPGSRTWYVLLYGVALSAYFGVNFYPLLGWEDIQDLVLVIRLIMIPGLLVYTAIIASRMNTKFTRAAIYISGVMILASFFFIEPFVPALIFAAMAIVVPVVLYNERLLASNRVTASN